MALRIEPVGHSHEEAVESLAEVIRQPLHDLTAAAEEAEKGRLGGAKLGVLVAAGGILKVLRAIDAEFERQRAAALRRDDASGAHQSM